MGEGEGEGGWCSQKIPSPRFLCLISYCAKHRVNDKRVMLVNCTGIHGMRNGTKLFANLRENCKVSSSKAAMYFADSTRFLPTFKF